MKSHAIKVLTMSLISLFSSLFSQAQSGLTTQKRNKVHADNGWSLFGSLSLNNQSVDDAGITAPINYVFNTLNNNVYKPGYSGGFRFDGVHNQKHYYTISFAVNRVSAGTNYEHKYTLAPYLDDFTHYKADNQFTTLSVSAHYKMLLPVSDMRKYKFYAILGPSLDYKISTIGEEHLINGASNRTFINGDLGGEFDNNGYYIFYAHYKVGSNLFHSPASIQMNRFELGMSIKVKDLF